jgi:hypothetical protein
MVADTGSSDSLPASSNAAAETPVHGLASNYRISNTYFVAVILVLFSVWLINLQSA